MPGLSILNTLIAMVIVILVLSLIVQSLQTFIKKIFKLKSRTILYSLEDLFETITRNSAATAPVKTPQQLVTAVTDRLKEMGRQTLLGNPMLDSLAKGDLLKVLTRVQAEDLLPGAVNNFQNVLAVIRQLKTELENIDAELLGGNASAKFSSMQASLMPLVHDIEALAGDGDLNPKLLLGDLYGLRQIKVADVLEILGQVQLTVEENLRAAGAADDAAQEALADAQKAGDAALLTAAQQRAARAAGALTGVKGVSAGLRRIAKQIAALGKAFDAAFAPLRERLQQAEVWYDTVMQGFEERYARHMRTVALVISVVVVMILNANFFSVYRAMAADPIKTQVLADSAPEYIKLARQEADAAGAAAGRPANASPSPTPATPADSATTVADLKRQGDKVNELVGTYKSFGIEPLTGEQLSNVFRGNVAAGDIFETLLGWLIMVMLLSAGAPFWQDTLESLFGLKNLLRQKSNTKNVEEGKGGQPQP